MIKMDDREIKRFESDLKTFKMRAYPFATKQTINAGAFDARKESQQHLKRNMTLRNKFTAGSIRVNQTRTLHVRRQEATVGSVADYLERQEFGGSVHKKGKRGVPIPTPYSAGQGLRRQPRTRLPRRENKLENIKIRFGADARTKRRGGRRGGRRQRNAIAVMMAAKTKSRFVFLELENKDGIFKVLGSAKKPRVKMTHDLTHPVVPTPRNPWLWPSVQKTKKKMPEIYLKALKFQIERHRIYK